MLNINHHASPKPWDFRRFGDLPLLFHTQFCFFSPSGACCNFSCTGQGTNYYMGPIHPRDKKPVGHLAAIRQALGAWNDESFHPPIFVMFEGDILSKPCLRWGEGWIFFVDGWRWAHLWEIWSSDPKDIGFKEAFFFLGKFHPVGGNNSLRVVFF